MQYTLDWVREQVTRLLADADKRAGNVRVHPNGFIQVDLLPVEETWHESHKQGHSGANLRLHVWNPPNHQLPRQETVNEVHDHVFDMKSTVVKGQLSQCLYAFEVGASADPTHELYRAVYNKSASSRLEPTGIKGKLILTDMFEIIEGEQYTQPAFTLHDSQAFDTVVTVMEKTEVHEGDATVICPINTPPDNEFDRATAATPDFLWAAIGAAIA